MTTMSSLCIAVANTREHSKVVPRNIASTLFKSMERIKTMRYGIKESYSTSKQKQTSSSRCGDSMTGTRFHRRHFSAINTPSLIEVDKLKANYIHFRTGGNRYITDFLRQDNSFKGLEETGEGTELCPSEVMELVKNCSRSEYSECIFVDVRENTVPYEGTINVRNLRTDCNESDGKNAYSINIPLAGSDADTLDDLIQELLSMIDEFEDDGKETNVIIYCNKGEWSYDFAKYLTRFCIDSTSVEDGYVKLYIISGGYDRWKREGYPTIENSPNH